MRTSFFRAAVLPAFGLAALSLSTAANAQPGHDAFDKPLGYDTGRQEQSAHNYLNQTGQEDFNGDSQVAPNQNYAGQNAYGTTRNQTRNNQSSDQNRRSDRDDDAQHHASLGISMHEDDGRVTVIGVMPGSPAAKAGLRVGDTIRYVGDQKIATAQGLAEEIGEYRPGSKVDLSIRRNGEKQTVSVTLGSRQQFGQNRMGANQYAANKPMDRQANRDWQDQSGRRGYSYNNGRQQNEWNQQQGATAQQGTNQQQLSQRVNQLQQQISQLQQELQSVRAQLNENQSATGQSSSEGQRTSYHERSSSRNSD